MKPSNFLKIILILISFSLINFSRAENKVTEQQILAPGYGSLEFTAPIPGSYKLPILGIASDGNVLDTQGKPLTLHSLMGDKITLLSFIYATCSDVNGCPLATAVFNKIKLRLKKEPTMAEHLRLITLSFNPEHDTPETMKHYGAAFQDQGVEWHFLTTQSEQTLQPILAHYKQNIQKVYNTEGQFTQTFSHILRVYLIDKNQRIRNIYSVNFLHPDTLINDIKTLLPSTPNAISVKSSDRAAINLFTPGDNKLNYDQSNYQTHSVALTDRIGQNTALINTVNKPSLGLPRVPVPINNPITANKIQLGRKLFYDRRLSLNNTFSCAMCHIPEQGFTNNEMATAVGIEGRTIRRNSPTLYNIAYATALFHDSRESTLEQQVWSPLLAHNEMANPSIGYVIDKINSSPDYNTLFKKTFGKEPSMETIGMAIASYERTLNSANSAFDRWFYGKDKAALNEKAQRGFQLFTGKAHCSNCHTLNSHSALFTDNGNHNTGIGYSTAMNKPDNTQHIQVSPGVYVDVNTTLIAKVAETKTNDLGRYEITQKPEDRWKYKTPSLRNISLTGPYMHNGSFETLNQVLEFYNQGGITNENIDALIKPLNLTEPELSDLKSFLESLTGDNINNIVADGFAAPIGESQ